MNPSNCNNLDSLPKVGSHRKAPGTRCSTDSLPDDVPLEALRHDDFLLKSIAGVERLSEVGVLDQGDIRNASSSRRLMGKTTSISAINVESEPSFWKFKSRALLVFGLPLLTIVAVVCYFWFGVHRVAKYADAATPTPVNPAPTRPCQDTPLGTCFLGCSSTVPEAQAGGELVLCDTPYGKPVRFPHDAAHRLIPSGSNIAELLQNGARRVDFQPLGEGAAAEVFAIEFIETDSQRGKLSFAFHSLYYVKLL